MKSAFIEFILRLAIANECYLWLDLAYIKIYYSLLGKNENFLSQLTLTLCILLLHTVN